MKVLHISQKTILMDTDFMSFDLLSLCQEVLKIRSVSSENSKFHLGNSRVVKFLQSAFHTRLEVKTFSAPGRPRDKTILIWPKGKSFPIRGGLALHTHLDTVAPGSSNDWTLAKPFDGRVVGGNLIGLGAADVKCDAICKILALAQAKIPSRAREFPFFIGSFSEEVGMYGIKWIVQEKLIRPRFALVGEPSDGNLSYSNKGFNLGIGRIRFKPLKYSGKKYAKVFAGKPAHSSAPQKARNAIDKALKFLSDHPQTPVGNFSGSIGINTIPGKFEIESTSSILPPETLHLLTRIWNEHQRWSKRLASRRRLSFFTPPTATSSWTTLRRENDEIIFTFDLRTLPGNEKPDLQIPSQLFKFKGVDLIREAPPFYENPRGEFGRWLSPLLSRGKSFITKSGSNEAPYYQKLGAQAFVCAPGISYGNVHSPNEKISVKALYEAQGFYARVIEKFNS